MAALLPSLGAHQRPNASIAMLATAAAVALLYFGRIFWITIIISLILALLLEPLVVLGLRMRIPRPVASALACLLAVVAIGLLAFGGYVQLMGLRDDLPLYGQRVNEMVDAVSARVEGVESKIVETVIPKRLRDADQPVARRRVQLHAVAQGQRDARQFLAGCRWMFRRVAAREDAEIVRLQLEHHGSRHAWRLA